jgi:hypothetical protein
VECELAHYDFDDLDLATLNEYAREVQEREAEARPVAFPVANSQAKQAYDYELEGAATLGTEDEWEEWVDAAVGAEEPCGGASSSSGYDRSRSRSRRRIAAETATATATSGLEASSSRDQAHSESEALEVHCSADDLHGWYAFLGLPCGDERVAINH